MKESIVQERVIQYLQKTGWLVNKIISCTLNGWSDLEAYKKGETIFIEIKQLGEEPEPLQLFRHQQMRAMGFRIFIIIGLEDITLLP